MPTLRNRISSVRAGGPRQFSEIREKIIIGTNEGEEDNLLSELDSINMSADLLDNESVAVASPQNKLVDTIDRLSKETDDLRVRQAVDELSKEDGVVDSTRATLKATAELLRKVRSLNIVNAADFALSFADFGPENLRMNITGMDTITEENWPDEDRTVGDLNKLLDIESAWSSYNRGGESIVAIFDTGFDTDMFRNERIVDTFHGDSVDSVHEPAEGHGTMCAGAAAANKEGPVPFNGVAPDSGVILVRTTDDEGQIRGDTITKAWDWLISKARSTSRPIIANHSYGIPICTGRPRGKYCSGPDVRLVKRASSTENITSVYAAGNEAGYCGRRLSGMTNGITGTNSISDVVTVGALRYDLRDAQRYSSHGRGDCAPVGDPKPNVSCALPHKTYYGTEDGWKIKDMSTGIGGSAGGTSHASPTTTGMIALIQSESMEQRGRPLQTEELKQIIHEAAEPPRRTQVNMFNAFAGSEGYDARFGHGQIQINEALEMI